MPKHRHGSFKCTAQKEHTCGHCGRKIAIGDSYLRFTDNSKRCAVCGGLVDALLELVAPKG